MISVVIPTYNEKACIKETIRRLWQHDDANLLQQIIVSDGGSTDGTPEEAQAEGVDVIHSLQKGRAAQMNYGARFASGDILYFLHADTLPPKGFTRDILQAFQEGYGAGCYRLSFDYNHWFLRANCWFTRFDVDALRFGDQSLFVAKKYFFEVGGFSVHHIVLEDQDMVKRLRKICRFTVLEKAVITSARKYLQNGIYKTQAIFFLIYILYCWGFPQKKLVATYRYLIRQEKL